MTRSVLLIGFLFFFATSFGQWNGIANKAISKTSFVELEPFPVTDGSGGSIVFFLYGDTYHIRAQRVTAAGTIAWGDSAHPVLVAASNSNFTKQIHAVPDGAGGAFVAWNDYRDYIGPTPDYKSEIYIQHINASGVSLWMASGIRVSNHLESDDYMPVLCLDKNGGVFVQWTWDNLADDYQSMLQHYNAAGHAQWAADGIQVISNPGFRSGTDMVSDDRNGVIIFVTDSRNDNHGLDYSYVWNNGFTNSDIYAQRLDSNAARLWSDSGVAVCVAARNQSQVIYGASSGSSKDSLGGAILVFQDNRNDVPVNGTPTNRDIYIQSIDSVGMPRFILNGIPVTTAAGNQIPSSVVFTMQSLVVAWKDETANNVGTQKVSVSGNIYWPANGVMLLPGGTATVYAPKVVSDGLGNYIYSVLNFTGTDGSISAQKISAAGITQWSSSGVQVCNTVNAYASDPRMISCNNGSAVVIWHDYRNYATTHHDIYGSRILADGTLANGYAGFITIANGNWNDPNIWSGGVVPSATSAVTVKNTVTVSANTICYSLKLNLPGSVTVNANVLLNVLH